LPALCPLPRRRAGPPSQLAEVASWLGIISAMEVGTTSERPASSARPGPTRSRCNVRGLVVAPERQSPWEPRQCVLAEKRLGRERSGCQWSQARPRRKSDQVQVKGWSPVIPTKGCHQRFQRSPTLLPGTSQEARASAVARVLAGRPLPPLEAPPGRQARRPPFQSPTVSLSIFRRVTLTRLVLPLHIGINECHLFRERIEAPSSPSDARTLMPWKAGHIAINRTEALRMHRIRRHWPLAPFSGI
jgi:hypothetical protein